MKPVVQATLAAIGVALMATAAQAANPATANLTIQATVVDLCTAADATLNFGTVNPTAGTLLPTTGIVNVTCSLLTPFTVGIGEGTHASGGERRMKRDGGADFLTYKLYKDLLMTARFGDTGSSDRQAGLGLGLLPTPISVFGTVPASQSAAAGTYSDIVQIVVAY